MCYYAVLEKGCFADFAILDDHASVHLELAGQGFDQPLLFGLMALQC